MNDNPRQELKGMSILVVDDLEDMRAHIITLLECAGYENLLSARDGAEAVTLLESGRRVDLVLLDIYMPEMSGYDVLARLKANEIDSSPRNYTEKCFVVCHFGNPVTDTADSTVVGPSMANQHSPNRERCHDVSCASVIQVTLTVTCIDFCTLLFTGRPWTD